MFSIALILYSIFIVGYGALAAALVYHVRTYTIPEDSLHTFIIPFLTLSLVLIILSLYFFLRIPWDTFAT
ncbi:MAG: hypothetical protein A3J55_03370 [Candidatus Ryanbacteria bacterium RIFCSPHIGHO2_02_FULL_45_17b]|uniref:Uncharacterized protein n=1 Tax=Candidatus Ryanbacteria bacterium RIFCSPHIGHO2_01_FULL_45_22 TaxID=1802114 RepID=A0A1G2G2Z8_9BACT|nr:MAG: hypothetical protein A2719_04570 [Candidatus Ryanbacteria bacterium RIFCSPHIGHO2_01_FULL_45_22]OGZ47501.1 MAG: hypothetical protein A3J55_03370 [Candidatus Ryanbacteria bacterium RIFCSPHIGHO2_02_FULL_45_17b]